MAFPNHLSGFIVLIVVLCLIILVSLTAIYILLRRDNTSDEELQKRNQRPRTATYVNPLEDDAGSPPSSWLRRTYQRLPFIRTASNDHVPQIKFPQKQSRGESIDASRNAWHVEPLDDHYLKAPHPRQANRLSHVDRLNTSIPNDPSAQRLSTSTSTYSVRFDLNGVRDILPFERDRFAPSPMATPPNIHTRVSSPTSSSGSSLVTMPPKRSRLASQDEASPSSSLPSAVRHEQDITQSSSPETSSSPSFARFEGGTRFLEAF